MEKSRSDHHKSQPRSRRKYDWSLIGMATFILVVLIYIVVVNLLSSEPNTKSTQTNSTQTKLIKENKKTIIINPTETNLKEDAKKTITEEIGEYFPEGGQYDEKMVVNNLNESYAVWGWIDYGEEEYMTYIVNYTKGGERQSMRLYDGDTDLVEEWDF